MSKLINTGSEYINLKDDGTFSTYKVRILQQGQHILRIDIDDQGKETPSFIIPKRLLTVNKTRGDIIQDQRGFLVEHEVLGLPLHADADKEYIEIPESDVPADYRTEDPVTKIQALNYKYNKSLGKLERK